MAALRRAAADDVFGRTGGVHDACLARADGTILARRADIGRHNALDKLYGMSILRTLETGDLVAAVSGRVSSEVLLKVAKMGVAFLLSKSACTDLALKLAGELGMTVVGFVRDGRLTVYTGEERILG
jgi:FdhD protein